MRNANRPADPYPYEDYRDMIRRPESRETLHETEVEAIVLLENKNNILPFSDDIGTIALIGPQANRVTVRSNYSRRSAKTNEALTVW